jgi:hypothetical protein
MLRQRVWLSYDLGVQGDYEALYQWLDAHAAVECGDSVASLEYDYPDNLPQNLRADLMGHVQFSPRARVYVIASDGGHGWLIGRPRRAPWEGYAPKQGGADFGWEPPPQERPKKRR